MLAAHDLAAAYDGRVVFSGLDLTLEPGAHALTGHNGSGKPTLLRLLAGAQAPAAGRVTIAGHDLARDGLAARRQLGYAPDDTASGAQEALLLVCSIDNSLCK